jgi:hypothetical protein
MVNQSRLLLPALLLVANCQSASASTWNFGSDGNGYVRNGSSYGNRLTYRQGTEKLRVTAWSDTADAPAGGFESAFLAQFPAGLGVCNRDEDTISHCISGTIDHQVDNVSQHDLVLFVFDSPQALQSITIDPYGVWDRDVSFWVGTVTPAINLTGSTFGALAGLGFGNRVDLRNSAGEDPLTLALGGLVGNALLVGGLYPADLSPDRFKIRSIVSTAPSVVPVPAAAWLLLSALGSLVGLRRVM